MPITSTIVEAAHWNVSSPPPSSVQLSKKSLELAQSQSGIEVLRAIIVLP